MKKNNCALGWTVIQPRKVSAFQEISDQYSLNRAISRFSCDERWHVLNVLSNWGIKKKNGSKIMKALPILIMQT